MKDKFINVIWIQTPIPHIYIKQLRNYDKLYEPSVLVHEYAHFFSKKAAWDGVFWDLGMTEAIAYYIQHLWLKEQAEKKLGLMSYYPPQEIEEEGLEESFPQMATLLYNVSFYCQGH